VSSNAQGKVTQTASSLWCDATNTNTCTVHCAFSRKMHIELHTVVQSLSLMAIDCGSSKCDRDKGRAVRQCSSFCSQDNDILMLHGFCQIFLASVAAIGHPCWVCRCG
jgi:hypothetical protein